MVGFRLRGIGTNRIWHALFRFESLFNTLLFAAHEGFHTKLWLTDLDTGYYRGIYEWRDPRSAVDYLETLRVVLRPWVEKGSFAYRVLEMSRDDYLAGLIAAEAGRPQHPPSGGCPSSSVRPDPPADGLWIRDQVPCPLDSARPTMVP